MFLTHCLIISLAKAFGLTSALLVAILMSNKYLQIVEINTLGSPHYGHLIYKVIYYALFDGCLRIQFKSSLRTDTHITFSLHSTPLGIRLSAFVAQPLAFLVFQKQSFSDIIQPIVKSKHLLDCLKQMQFKDQNVLLNKVISDY